MAQVIITKTDSRTPKTIFAVINSKTRIEILKALEWDEMSYQQLQMIALRHTKVTPHYLQHLVAHHLRNLRQYHLILKKPNRNYYLSVRGMSVLKGIRIIENSEMFI